MPLDNYPTGEQIFDRVKDFEKYSGNFKEYIQSVWKASPEMVKNYCASGEAFAKLLSEKIAHHKQLIIRIEKEIIPLRDQLWRATADSAIIRSLQTQIDIKLHFISQFVAQNRALQGTIQSIRHFQGSASQYLQSLGIAIGLGGYTSLYVGIAAFLKFAVIAGIIIGAGYLIKKGYDSYYSDNSSKTESNVDWDKSFSSPQYILHINGHSTMDGYINEDYYELYPAIPNSEGILLKPDSQGGTFSYNAEMIGGPFSTPREVCNAARGIPVPSNFTWTVGWGHYVISFSQNECP